MKVTASAMSRASIVWPNWDRMPSRTSGRLCPASSVAVAPESVEGGAEQHDTGVVDQRVEAAENADRALDRVGGLLGVGDVGFQDQHGPAVATDVGGDRLQRVLGRQFRSHMPP